MSSVYGSVLAFIYFFILGAYLPLLLKEDTVRPIQKVDTYIQKGLLPQTYLHLT